LITIGNQEVTLDSLYTPNSFSVNENVETTSYSVFAEGTYDLTDSLRLTAGARWTDDEKKLKRGSMDGDPDFFWNSDPGLRVSGEDSWNEPTYRLGLSWHATDDIMLFATTSKGFRSGAFDVAQSDTSFSDKAVAPETAYSHEIGFKSTLFDGRMRLNLTAFDVTYEDLQFFINTGGASVTTNAGEASVEGVEVEFLALLTDDITFSLQYSHQDGDSTDIPVEAEIPEGTPPQGTIPNTYIARLSYETVLSGGSSLYASIDYTKKDEYSLEFNDVPQFRSEVDGLINARLAYKFADDGWEIAAWGKNLTDEDIVIYGQDFWFSYYDSASYGTNPEIANETAQPRYGDPRTYGVTLSYTF
jgi:iron complex outermembrane receptor protein